MSEAFVRSWISLRHHSELKQYKGFLKPPASHDLFDWVVWSPNDPKTNRTDIANPRTILCRAMPRSIKKLLSLLTNNSDATLVLGGCDVPLSGSLKLLAPNLHRFKKIFYEAKDIDHDKISSFPMGFNSFYLREAGYENIKAAVTRSNSSEKSELLLAAWGKRWKRLDKTIEERRAADSFLDDHPVFRRKMVKWDQYWFELANHHFLLAPKGNGIQAPKLSEAWMVKTVPVVVRNSCFSDLYAMGFPMVFVDDWQEVTPLMLNDWLKENDSIDWKRVRYQLTNEYLKTLIIDEG